MTSNIAILSYCLCIVSEQMGKLMLWHTVYPKKYVHCFVVLCFVVVMQSFIMNSHEVFIHIHQGCFAGTGAIVRLSQCQWSKPDGYGKISQCITTTKHSKAKTVRIFHGIYCTLKKASNANLWRFVFVSLNKLLNQTFDSLCIVVGISQDHISHCLAACLKPRSY